MRALVTLAVVLLTVGCAGPEWRSDALKVHYAELETRLRADGLMRDESVAADAPFSSGDLIRNFELIALHTEFDDSKNDLVPKQTSIHLTRWDGPVKINLSGFGVRPNDGVVLRELAAQLEGAAGIPFEIVPASQANLQIVMFDAEQRDDFTRAIAAGPVAKEYQAFEIWAQDDWSPCIATTFEDDDARPGVITGALIIIKDETANLMRKSCFHEELTQALGLLNDHPDVRPSMFNDDEEFALLTEHDEFLLRMLYHPLLKPDMSADEVRPHLPAIVAELRRGP